MTNLGKSSRSHYGLYLSYKEMWFDELDDLGSEMKGTGTNTDSGIIFKSSLSSKVNFSSRVESKSKN